MVNLKDSKISWIGVIPVNWEVCRVKDLFWRRKEENQVSDPVVLSLARSGVRIRDISNNEGQMAASYDKYHRVYINDLMLNPMDLVSGANCSISKVEGVISPAYINLVAKEKVYPRYYDYYFKTQYWSKAMFIHGNGVSFDNRWTINTETLMRYYCPKPSFSEQVTIADFLDEKCAEIEDLIGRAGGGTEATTQDAGSLKASLFDYKKSIIYEYVTGKKRVI